MAVLTSFSTVDHDTLCPFCDEPLPPQPSSRLQRLIERARLHARAQPRVANSKGLIAPFAIFIGACNQHRDETTVIPEGVAQGWPTNIDFDAIPTRLKAMRPRLLSFIERPNTSTFFQKAMEDVASMGALASVGAQGQLAAFQRSRPG